MNGETGTAMPFPFSFGRYENRRRPHLLPGADGGDRDDDALPAAPSVPLSGMTILRPFLFAALLALPGVPAIAADAPDTVAQFRERAWTTLEKAPSFRPKTEYLFGTLGMDQASRFDYWLIRLSEKEPDAPQWADSRTCPALRAAVAAMASGADLARSPDLRQG